MRPKWSILLTVKKLCVISAFVFGKSDSKKWKFGEVSRRIKFYLSNLIKELGSEVLSPKITGISSAPRKMVLI